MSFDPAPGNLLTNAPMVGDASAIDLASSESQSAMPFRRRVRFSMRAALRNDLEEARAFLAAAHSETRSDVYRVLLALGMLLGDETSTESLQAVADSGDALALAALVTNDEHEQADALFELFMAISV